MNKQFHITLATRNAGKIRELNQLLNELNIIAKGIDEIVQMAPIDETGTTFEENATIKARAVQQAVGGWVLADDSGIELDDLGGRPGVQSAYFAGPRATDGENCQEMLCQLNKVQQPSLKARYVCVLVLLNPDGQKHTVSAFCDGLIKHSPSGSGGFGYDPYFFLPEKNRTMAELSLDEKNKISHRGKALAQFKELLARLVGSTI